MMRLFSKVFLLLSLFSAGVAQAQNTAGYGDWQLHLPTTHPQKLADAGNRLYVVAENAFYFLDKNLNTTQVLSSRDGLHDVGASLVAYDSTKRQTFVVYQNSNIDVISASGAVTNIGDVLRKTVQGVRTVYDLMLVGRRGYLSTSFGLIVLDLDKLEVKDTYASIGPAGEDVEVYASTVTHDSLFAATSKGLQFGRLSDNLLDYQSWTHPGAEPSLTNNRTLATYQNHVYAGVNSNGVFVYHRAGNAWQPIYGGYASQILRLKATKAGLLVASDALGVLHVETVTAGAYPVVLAPAATGDRVMDFVQEADGNYYVANYSTGLQHVYATGNLARETYIANGPQTSLSYGILADARSNTIDIFSGGYSTAYVADGKKAGFYEYKNNQWTNFTQENYPNVEDYPNLADQSRGARAADGTLYVATFKDGLLQWRGVHDFTLFNIGVNNAPFLTRDGVAGYVQIPDVAVAPSGKVWVVNYHKQPNSSGLFTFNPRTNSWNKINYFDYSNSLERIVIDDLEQAWVSASRKGSGTGVYVVDSTSANNHFQMNTGSEEVYDLVKDRVGDIWAATGKGLAVLNDPSGGLTGTSSFRAPIVRKGDGAGFPVLFTDIAKAIAVDGGNRKWVGTDNGLWLFSADADEALLHFTTANSPLPSNHITDVDVNNKTGEVWIATEAGVVSYLGSASVTDGAPDCTKVFPNPVRPDFTGTMGITGVVNDALVKITDVAGHLVYSTKATGGSVTGNMNDVHGQRVRSGVYLVLTSDADGGNTCVSKVAVLSN